MKSTPADMNCTSRARRSRAGSPGRSSVPVFRASRTVASDSACRREASSSSWRYTASALPPSSAATAARPFSSRSNVTASRGTSISPALVASPRTRVAAVLRGGCEHRGGRVVATGAGSQPGTRGSDMLRPPRPCGSHRGQSAPSIRPATRAVPEVSAPWLTPARPAWCRRWHRGKVGQLTARDPLRAGRTGNSGPG